MQYFHVVYTLPSELRDIAYQNKRVIYDLLMKAAAETTLAIATIQAPRRRNGVTAVRQRGNRRSTIIRRAIRLAGWRAIWIPRMVVVSPVMLGATSLAFVRLR